jgi:hypothetical protein
MTYACFCPVGESQTAALIWLTGIPTVLSFNRWSAVYPPAGISKALSESLTLAGDAALILRRTRRRPLCGVDGYAAKATPKDRA